MRIQNQPKQVQDVVINRLRGAIIHLEGEMLEKLCDFAMSGDRGISSCFEAFEFKLGRTIAQGHEVREVCFSRKK